MHATDTTIERLAFDIRIAQGPYETALLEPARDPEIMLSAAMQVACALDGIPDIRRVQITRSANAWPQATIATLTLDLPDQHGVLDARVGTFAERRMYVCHLDVPELSAQVIVSPTHMREAREALSRIGQVRAICGWLLDVTLDVAVHEGFVS